VSDADLARQLGIDPALVTTYSRGRERRFSPDGEGPADLAARAAASVLADAGLQADALDLVLFATNTPDITFPGSACLLQAKLDAGTVGSMDVRGQCTGFLVALDLARRFVGSGSCERVLVAAGEVPSHQTRFDGLAPELTCLTTDAAAVGVVTAEDASGPALAIRSCEVRTDGSLHKQFWCQYPASRNLGRKGAARGERLQKWMVEEGGIYPQADFAAMRDTAVARVPEVFDRALTDAGLNRVDHAIVAHVDPDTEAAMRDALSTRVGRFYEHGNLYAYGATLPVALAELSASGSIEAGQTIALAAAGGGASWGTAIVEVEG